ncbi:MAG: hypothetical protein GMKNLPBB_00080 [Myxococcota bacterium]|nr:hypothetical protein [Myxococcota bacterium]
MTRGGTVMRLLILAAMLAGPVLAGCGSSTPAAPDFPDNSSGGGTGVLPDASSGGAVDTGAVSTDASTDAGTGTDTGDPPPDVAPPPPPADCAKDVKKGTPCEGYLSCNVCCPQNSPPCNRECEKKIDLLCGGCIQKAYACMQEKKCLNAANQPDFVCALQHCPDELGACFGQIPGLPERIASCAAPTICSKPAAEIPFGVCVPPGWSPESMEQFPPGSAGGMCSLDGPRCEAGTFCAADPKTRQGVCFAACPSSEAPGGGGEGPSKDCATGETCISTGTTTHCVPLKPDGQPYDDASFTRGKTPGTKNAVCDVKKCSAGLVCISHPSGAFDACLTPCKASAP